MREREREKNRGREGEYLEENVAIKFVCGKVFYFLDSFKTLFLGNEMLPSRCESTAMRVLLDQHSYVLTFPFSPPSSLFSLSAVFYFLTLKSYTKLYLFNYKMLNRSNFIS